MERYCTFNFYLSLINKINTNDTNTDSSTTTSLMFKLSSLFENSVTKVGGAETSKFGHIPQFGDFRSNMNQFRKNALKSKLNYVIIAQRSVSEQGIK